MVFGICGAVCCNLSLNLKNILQYDDALDVFAVHGVGGIVGNLLTGIFAQRAYGGDIEGGWLDGNWMQIVHQLVDTAAGLTWSFIMTYIILFVMNKIPGLSLRVGADVERAGLDQAELGVSCYEYVEDVKISTNNIKFGNFDISVIGKQQNGNGNFELQMKTAEEIKAAATTYYSERF